MRPRSSRTVKSGCSYPWPGALKLSKSRRTAERRSPSGDHAAHPARSIRPAEQGQQAFAVRSVTLSNHSDAAVGQVLRRSRQAEFERTGPGPPAEPDALDVAGHPGGQPDVTVLVRITRRHWPSHVASITSVTAAALLSPPGSHHRALTTGLSPPAAAGPGLALRAGVGGPVHERVAAHRRAAPRARLVLAAVDGQRPVE